MPDYRSMFDSAWIKAWDLQGQDVTVTISKVTAGSIDNKEDGTKKRVPILWFKGWSKSLALNTTNSRAVATLYGTMTEKWVGKALTLYPTRTTMKGTEVDCIRIRPQIPDATEVSNGQPQPPIVDDDGVVQQ